jgi:hypothetical protein
MPTGLARRVAPNEAPKPSAATTVTSGPPSAPVKARRAAPSIREPGEVQPPTPETKKIDTPDKKPDKKIADKIVRGRPSTTGKPWIKAGISRQAWYRLQAKAKAKVKAQAKVKR